MDAIYEAMRLGSAEFECLQAVSLEGYIPLERLYLDYESVAEFPRERVEAALEFLSKKHYINLSPHSMMLTPLGKKVIEFDESTCRFE